MFKIKNDISPRPIRDLFNENSNLYDLRNKRCWETSKIRTILNGTETFRYRGPKTWGIVPHNIRNSETLTEFKKKIKMWKHLVSRFSVK